jgi:ferredoxin
MKIVVDYDRCESNGVCMGILPEVFEVRDDDFMYVLNETPPESMRKKVLEAVNSCPTAALSLAEDAPPGGAASEGVKSADAKSAGAKSGGAASAGKSGPG